MEDASLSLNSLVAAVMPIAVLALFLLAAAAVYVKRRWHVWMEAALDDTFKKMDLDNSGTINGDELYIAVCEFYLKLHTFGANVRSPKRPNLVRLLAEFDIDGDGAIRRAEFGLLVEQLITEQAGRITLQVILTILAPVSASFVTRGIRYACTDVMGLHEPLALVPFTDRLPDTLDETLVTGALLCCVAPLLGLFDMIVENYAKRKANKARLSTAAAAGLSTVSGKKQQ